MNELPKQFQKLMEEYPTIKSAYENLGTAVHEAGPLDNKTRVLVKLAVSVGARLEGAVHSQVRKAVNLGISKEEIYQVALLAIPTIGLPSTTAALSWIDDILENY